MIAAASVVSRRSVRAALYLLIAATGFGVRTAHAGQASTNDTAGSSPASGRGHQFHISWSALTGQDTNTLSGPTTSVDQQREVTGLSQNAETLLQYTRTGRHATFIVGGFV